MDIQEIKEIALANGFSLKEQASGNMDLHSYVYEFANAIEQAAKAQAVPEWNSAQDKLPEFQQEVLILVGDEYLVAEYLPSVTNEFGIQFKEGFWINGGASVVDADLWMSPPQPPKAQEQSNA